MILGIDRRTTARISMQAALCGLLENFIWRLLCIFIKA
jgi:hypothetical protein